ncbi:hypothetical protein [Desulfovibrio sp. ZJ200]|uniref:hypothetical protein n=1 Tax=Desulfovibrio sp. ZJ200 TaxID=2709792 RepID=UPI0013ECA2EE|nr:hypothetical protein [Desulfovibrio sp. ZJ200]
MVRNILTVAGYSLIGAGQNAGQVYIVLRDWDRRTSPEMQIERFAVENGNRSGKPL